MPVIARERRRLSSQEERERLARSLEVLHRDALRWRQTPPRYRPLPGIVQPRDVSQEVAAVVTALRHDGVRVQGVALASRLLSDGQASPLYANDVRALREELNRIRYLLDCKSEIARRDADLSVSAAA